MKNKILTVIAIIVFILLLILASIFINKITDKKIIRENINKSNNNLSVNYVIEVDENNFKSEVLESPKNVLIDFYATWCRPCKLLSPIIDEVAEENNDIKFVRIDVDKCNNLANEYGIQYMPTLVLVENGEEKDRSIGLIDKEALLDFIEK